MEDIDDSHNDNKGAFWKKNTKNVPGSIKPVYGAMHPPRLESQPSTPKKGDSLKYKHKRNASSSSFQDFQQSTDDAWDLGDDDFYVVSDVKILPRVAQSTAISVITNHSELNKLSLYNHENSKNGSRSINSPSSSPEIRAAAMQRLAIQKDASSPSRHPSPPVISHMHPQGPGLGIRQTPYSYPQRVSTREPLQSHNSPGVTEREIARLEKFSTLLKGPNTDLDDLRKLSWSGIPTSVRPDTWRLLSGYLPANADRRKSSLERKRVEYFNFIRQYYDTRHEDVYQETYRQIHIDVPRMSPLVPLFQQEIVQEAFERVLYIWAIRHPASGYVQGMNDLVTPFFVVFLQEVVPPDTEVEEYDVSELSRDKLQEIEADSFWCMSKLLDGIQDNYTFAQPGIQSKVNLLKELTQRIDAPLHEHLHRHSVEYLQFSFRWMNNLLMRELPLRCTIRLWDTYLSETNGFSTFHLYVCAAFLTHWSKDLLQEKDFQGLMLTLQNLPTLHWGNEEMSLLVAEAYRLKFMFADAPNHLQLTKK
ncbi:TBC1 domain family member 22B [Centruroides vittatus]|uniref:TBC1 domain family member 22B n=1 Tax=Centruroides vittatus TaxID=120091 RepID=UPI00350F63E1